ncbi:MAG: N-(5'-phosphoribosyl)anthranilate isomerase, partial [Rhodobacteraceae bacterium]|nr:N-(5'-phosphoribosyl)anthranilate isomerase [Paracoccaceae bacterium]
RNWPLPWMLAGGLSPETVPAALQMTATRQLDVSSGIETSPGVKDQGLMLAFMAAVQRHQTQTT